MADSPFTVAPPSVRCPCVKKHSPDPGIHLDLHHIVPRSWQGEDVTSNLVWVCKTIHGLVHAGLNLAVKLKRAPTVAELKAVGIGNRYAQRLIRRAIDEYLATHEGAWPTKYTLHREAP